MFLDDSSSQKNVNILFRDVSSDIHHGEGVPPSGSPFRPRALQPTRCVGHSRKVSTYRRISWHAGLTYRYP
jgi:hypothetical protein